MFRKLMVVGILGLWIGAGFISLAQAGGLSVTFCSPVLEHVSPGGVYNLKQMRGLVYTVANGYSTEREFEVKVRKPGSSLLDKAYEPIPDISWIRMIPEGFKLKPGEKMPCTIILSIPDEEKYIGHHYQAQLTAEVKPVSTSERGFKIATAATFKLKFNVGTVEPEELLAKRKQERFMELNYRFEPESFFMRKEIEPGREVYIGRLGGLRGFFSSKELPGVKIVNLGPETIKLKFKSIPCEKRFGVAEGYQPAPKPEFLRCRVKQIKIKSNQIKDVPLVLKIPVKPEYQVKKYAFILKAELFDTDVPLEIYSRIYVRIKE